jgi:hypothetical protein
VVLEDGAALHVPQAELAEIKLRQASVLLRIRRRKPARGYGGNSITEKKIDTTKFQFETCQTQSPLPFQVNPGEFVSITFLLKIRIVVVKVIKTFSLS